MVQCFCDHLTDFASDFFVAPNAIDWDKITLENLLQNMVVFSVVVSIFALYLILVILVRRMDKNDLEKVRSVRYDMPGGGGYFV